MRVLDLSQYDLPTYDPACLKANGVTAAIFGVFHPSGPKVMRQAAQRALDAGIAVPAFYGLPYFGSPSGEARDISWAIENCLILGVPRVWIDCEIDAKEIGFTDDQGATPARRVRVIREMVAAIEAAGLSAGIYTGAWWWPGQTGNSTEFAHLPLWHAAYPVDGSAIRTVSYGGWSEVAIHQYTSSFNVCGRNRDANYVFEEENDMTPEERAKLDAVYAALTGGVPGVIEAWNANGNSVLVAYNDLVFPHLGDDAKHTPASGVPNHRHILDQLGPASTGGVA